MVDPEKLTLESARELSGGKRMRWYGSICSACDAYTGLCPDNPGASWSTSMRTTSSRTLFAATLGLFVVSVPLAAAPAQQHAAHEVDALQTKLVARTRAVDAKLAAARKAGRVSSADAARMKKKLGWVRMDSAKYVKQQGFLSAGESASYNRALDEIEAKLS